MAKLQNTLQAPVTVHGTQQYDLAPGQVVEVDDKTDWKGNPYVKCGALVLNPGARASDEEPKKGKK